MHVYAAIWYGLAAVPCAPNLSALAFRCIGTLANRAG